MTDTDSPGSEKVKIIAPQNTLKMKAGATSIDRTAMLENAKKALTGLQDEFGGWMEDEVDNLTTAFKAWNENDGADTTLYRSCHDIKGQAATLGYPVVGRIANSLCTLLQSEGGNGETVKTLIERHVVAIRAAVREQIQGDDHPIADALANELDNLVAQIVSTSDSD